MEKYYFKTRWQEPDIECTEICMFRNNGIRIGSAACQDCKHHIKNDFDKFYSISWIICEKIEEAILKTPKTTLTNGKQKDT